MSSHARVYPPSGCFLLNFSPSKSREEFRQHLLKMRNEAKTVEEFTEINRYMKLEMFH